jgi:hypothetical protein
MRKIIFLDIDGVLNCQKSESRCCGFVGIDDDKVKRLRKIIEATGAKIVLTSTWKKDWIRDPNLKDEQNEYGNYLERKLRRENLFILDKTTDEKSLGDRGEGIFNYLKSHNVDQWIAIDDEIFHDFEDYGVIEHLVKTSFYGENGGIQDEHMQLAIEMLNKTE